MSFAFALGIACFAFNQFTEPIPGLADTVLVGLTTGQPGRPIEEAMNGA